MKPASNRNLRSSLIFFVIVAFLFPFSYLGVNPRAQSQTELPARTGYVNDFAGVLDEKTKQRLEAILENVQRRSGIALNVATVQTTGVQDIFDFSRQLANNWDIGARNSKKSLLLVMSVNEKAVFTQFSKSVQPQLPEGILGELGVRMRAPVGAGNFGEGLSNGVQHLVSALAQKIGFDLTDIDQPPAATALVTPDENPTAGNTEEAARVVTTPTINLTRSRTVSPKPRASTSKTASDPIDDEAEAEEVELTLTLPLQERLTTLKEFLATHQNSKANARAIELLVSTHAGLGDQRLKNGDSKGGVDELMLAITEAPANTSEKLFSGVVSQIPSNLYLRGEQTAAFEAARLIESKFGSDPKRLLAIAAFYMGLEEGQEAARIAAQAVKLAPDSAEAHYALGLGLHISLELDQAAAEYKRALDLDPNSPGARGVRRSLADLSRAAGKADEALALYRENLSTEPKDKAARAGMILSLLEAKQTEAATRELAVALEEDPRNLPLLAGAAYWFAAHDDFDQAFELSMKAVIIEPRYTWSQIAAARALIAKKKPLEAERNVRFARQHGKFPTLDYELANVLAAAGLYQEAAEVLMGTFRLKDGQIETRLAGRVSTQAPSFIELLAPERRASIFQFAPADNATNAAMLKALLAFAIATNDSGDNDKLDETLAVNAAREFSAGGDDMRVYRQLYAASRLLRKGIALQTAYELTEAARSSVESALDIPAVTVAVQADEYREIRARAIAQNATPNIAEAPRNVLANILHGRIEDLAGWSLLNQSKTEAAIKHLKRAVNTLPEGTPSWRSALWRLATAHEQAGMQQEALISYIKSYKSGEADPARRAVIAQLYRKVNGSLDGLEQHIGAGGQLASASPVSASPAEKPVSIDTPTPSALPESQPAPSDELTPTPAPVNSPTPVEVAPAATPEVTPTPEATPDPTPDPTPDKTPMPESPIPDSSPQAIREVAKTPLPTPEVNSATADRSPEAAPQPSPTPTSEATLQEMSTRLRQTLSITGRVTDADNNAMTNVVVVLISPRGTVLAATTDGLGGYSFLISPTQLGYRIIPSKDGYTFSPLDRVLVGINDDQKRIDFVGAKTRAP